MQPLTLALPTSLLLFLQFSSFAWAQSPPIATLTPPKPSGSASTTASLNATTTVSSASVNSTSATPTSSAMFPSLSGYSSCVTTCLALGSAAANCTSLVDVNCFCVSSRFVQEMFTCVSSNCTSELTSAENLSQQFCALANTSTSLSFPSTSIASTSSGLSSSSSSAHASTTTAPVSATSAESTSASASATSNAAAVGSIGAVGPSLMASAMVSVVAMIAGAFLCV